MKTERDHTQDWFYEGRISRVLVDHLKSAGYTILKDNSNNIKAKGADIIVKKDGITEVIEVKGWPSDYYTIGEKKGQLKTKTKPEQQAKHWFSEALVTCLSNHGKHQGAIVGMAFPNKETYWELMEKVEDYFTDNEAELKVYFIDRKGKLNTTNLNMETNI